MLEINLFFNNNSVIINFERGRLAFDQSFFHVNSTLNLGGVLI